MLFESYRTSVKPARPPIGPIQLGDILVKESDSSILGHVINGAQWVISGAGAYAKWAHAGLATSARNIAEMDGHGLQHHDLATDNARFTYAVFRCKYRDVAVGAAETANMMLGFAGNAKGHVAYSKLKAATSTLYSYHASADRNRINTFLDTVLAGKDVDLFCSEFVVFCYVVALEQSGLLPARSRPDLPGLATFFGYEPGEYSPAYLYEMLIKHQWFEYIGLYKGMRWS